MDAADLDDLDEAPPRTPNIPLRALWIVGGVLLAAGVGGVTAIVSANSAMYGAVTSTSMDFALAQALSAITPSVLTSGLVCIGLALAAHAITHRDERVIVISGETVPPEPRREDEVPPIDEPAIAVVPEPLDHELFKRPTVDAADLKHRGHTAL